MIYLASPYSHRYATIQQRRYEQVLYIAYKYTVRGILAYSPIVHYHVMAERFDMPKTSEFWEPFNKAMLDKADVLHVLKIEGWLESNGVQEEIAYAKQIKLPVEFIEVDQWLK